MATKELTKEQAIALFGSVKALRDALGLKTRSAIYMWPNGEPIPRDHFMTIRYELRRDAFDEQGNLRPEFCLVAANDEGRLDDAA